MVSSVNVTVDCSEDFEAQEDKAVLWEKGTEEGDENNGVILRLVQQLASVKGSS